MIGTDISKLDSYIPNTEQLKLEIAKMKLRKYADGYQEKGSEFDQRTSNLLLSILIAKGSSLPGITLALVLGRSTDTPTVNKGAVTIKITSKTNITSTNGVTLISDIGL